MKDNEAIPSSSPPRSEPWNKGKLIGAKPPLRASHVWSIRTRLQLEKRTRDLALFNLAIDSKLRGCDVVAMRVDDVAPNGYTLDRATVRQKKTGRPVRFELTEQTRQAIDEYLRLNGRKLASSCSQVVVATAMASQHVNMHARLVSGSRASASTRSSSARTPCAEPK
jgi:integrase